MDDEKETVKKEEVVTTEEKPKTVKKRKKQEVDQEQSFITFVIVLAIVLFCFWIGYSLGNRYLVPKVEPEEVPEEKLETEMDTEDPEVKDLISRLVAGPDCWNIDYYTNDTKVTTKTLPIERIFQVTSIASFSSKGVESITLEDFDTEIQKYFDTGYTFNPETISYQGPECFDYSYDAEEQRFIKQENVCESTCGPNSSQYLITRAVKREDSLLIYVKVLFGSQAESTNYFSDYERTNFITNDPESLDENLRYGTDYFFTFKLVEDNYVFVSSEKM